MRSTFIISFLLLTVFSVTISCKKKDIQPESQDPATEACDTTFVNNYINDTILPSDYLMTYPGSEWNYDDNSTVTCDQWENIAIAATTTSGNCVTVMKDYRYVPHCSSAPYYIADNRAVDISDPFSTQSIPLLDTTVGVFHQYSYSYQGQNEFDIIHVNNTYTVVEKLESMEVLSVTYPDVIHVRLYVQAYGHFYNSATYHFYYAKNVGLIKYIMGESPQTVTEKNLISYTIGPH